MARRTRTFVRELLCGGLYDTGGAETVLVVAHCYAIQCLLLALLGGGVDALHCEGLANCELIVLDRRRGSCPDVGPTAPAYQITARVRVGAAGERARVRRADHGHGAVSAAGQWGAYRSLGAEAEGPDAISASRRRVAPLARSSASQATT